MFEREPIARPRRRSTPAADSSVFAARSQEMVSALSADDGTFRAPYVGFDIGSIAIYPPQQEVDPAGSALSPTLTDRIRAQEGRGTTMDPATQMKMEAGFGQSFADVHIHADGESDVLNRSVGAQAFTLGSDIFLGGEAMGACGDGGDRLLAHELTHVVQQRGTQQDGPLTVGAANDGHEREADRVAGAVVSRSGTVSDSMEGTAAAAAIQRDRPDNPQAFPGVVALLNPRSNPTPAADEGGMFITWSMRFVTQQHPDAGGSPGGEIVASAGDLIVVEANLAGSPYMGSDWRMLTKADTVPLDSSDGRFVHVNEAWTDVGIHTWTITLTGGGHYNLHLGVAPQPLTSGTSSTSFEPTADPWQSRRVEENVIRLIARAPIQWFQNEMTAATLALIETYGKAAPWFANAYENYFNAYTAFTKAIHDQRDADEHAHDIAKALLFAVVAGGIGGALGRFVEETLTPGLQAAGKVVAEGIANATKGEVNLAAEALITRVALATYNSAAKDATKVVAGAAINLAGGGSKAAGKGKDQVPSDDPTVWFAKMEAKIKAEQGEVAGKLKIVTQALSETIITDPSVMFDWDPPALVEKEARLAGYPISQLPTEPEEKDYAGTFWKTWLANYGWTVEWEDRGGHQYPSVENNIGSSGPLYKALDKVAQENGATADAWIEQYGSQSKKSAKAELKQIEAEDDAAYRRSLYNLTH